MKCRVWVVMVVIAMLTVYGWIGNALAADLSGKIAFVRDGNIWIADASGNHQRQLTKSGACAEYDISSDGKTLVYSNGSIWLVPLTKGAPKKIGSEEECQGPIFSPDNKQVAYVAKHKDASVIFLYDLPSGKKRTLYLDRKRYFGSVSWSHSGRYLLTSTDMSETTDFGFVVYDLVKNKPMIYPNKYDYFFGCWLAGDNFAGMHQYFDKEGLGRHALARYQIGQNAPTKILITECDTNYMVSSPDGRMVGCILNSVGPNNDNVLEVISADGHHRSKLANISPETHICPMPGDGCDFEATFSPDNRWVAFDNKLDIWVVSVDGSSQPRLLFKNASLSRWLPK